MDSFCSQEAPETPDWQRSAEVLEVSNSELLDEIERLTTEVEARRDPRPLVTALVEYLDWLDDPNGRMSRDAQAIVSRQLRHALDKRLSEMRA